MDKIKRVEEMAKIIKPLMPNQCEFVETQGCIMGDDVDCPECVIAQWLDRAGYRKGSEIAREIRAMAESLMSERSGDVGYQYALQQLIKMMADRYGIAEAK